MWVPTSQAHVHRINSCVSQPKDPAGLYVTRKSLHARLFPCHVRSSTPFPQPVNATTLGATGAGPLEVPSPIGLAMIRCRSNQYELDGRDRVNRDAFTALFNGFITTLPRVAGASRHPRPALFGLLILNRKLFQ